MTAARARRSRRHTHRTKRWIGTTVCAALIVSPTLVISSAPAQAADSVFYLSGTRNNPAPQQMVDLADIGAAFTFFGEQALQIGYAAALFPFQGATALNASVAEGLANLVAALEAAPAGDRLVLIGVSQGDIVLSLLEQALLAAGEARDVLFVRMAGPSGDTGVMGRNWGFKLPGLSFVTRPDESPFDQIVLNHEYDGLGHWPVNQLNVLAVLNAVLGTLTFHNPNAYAVDLSAFPESDITTTVNSLGATTTTYLIRATGLLPLLRPLQALGIDEGLLNDWHQKLKPIIDSAYEPGRAPVLARVVQSMVRAVVNQMTAMADGIGAVLRRIDAAHRARNTPTVESAPDTDTTTSIAAAGHLSAPLTQAEPISGSKGADPEVAADHVAVQSNTEPERGSGSEPDPAADQSTTKDSPAEPGDAMPAGEPDAVDDRDEPAALDLAGPEDAGSQDDATTTVNNDNGSPTHHVDPADSPRDSDTAETRTPPRTHDTDQDSGPEPETGPRSPRTARTASQPGLTARSGDREISGPSSRKDTSRLTKSPGGKS